MYQRLAVGLLLLLSGRGGASPLHTDGPYFRDDQGGAVLLHGINLGGNAKVPPFRAVDDVAQLDPLPRWGINTLRLLFTWEAFEPTAGAYDQSYLDYYTGVVDAAASRGLYVIVDFHQDGFSRFALGGCGEGFPVWALPTGVTPATPDNGPNCSNWGPRALNDPQLAAVWNGFYANDHGVRDRYLAMVGKVAAALAGRDNVIGYDLMNEPGGDEVQQIAPLYTDVARVVRAAHPGAILFVSPHMRTSSGSLTLLPPPSFDNFAYSPHFYDPTIFLFRAWGGSDESAAFATMNSVALAWRAPLFVGEWGAPPSTGQIGGYLNAMANAFDRGFISSAEWCYTPGWRLAAKDGWNQEDFSIVDDHGALRANFVPRPTARRIAGAPTTVAVTNEADVHRNTMTVIWHHDPALGATELYAPVAWFGGDVVVDVQGDLHCARKDDLVRCEAPSAGDKGLRIRNSQAPRCGLTGLEAVLVIWALRRRRARRSEVCAPPAG